jgi:23S rRNA (adenine2030-N6)-methyltransferase
LFCVLAYRHLFHAGNFADVFKHALLARLLLLLTRKDKPLCYLDTHAGIGRYDLSHAWARKLAEHEDGIARLWSRNDVPELLEPYLSIVRAQNRDRPLRFYPGSPIIAHELLRATDRMVLVELNREDCARLGHLFAQERRVKVVNDDGYHALKAFLPPHERRGLTLIDSSFDRAGEFERLTRAAVLAHERFATGVYAFWYPLMEPPAMHAFERAVVATGIRKILQIEVSVFAQSWRASLRGCGMLVINPPFGFEQQSRAVLDWLWPVLSEEKEGGVRVRWLVPE